MMVTVMVTMMGTVVVTISDGVINGDRDNDDCGGDSKVM